MNSRAYRHYVLVVLVVVYAFNFIDRQIVGILAVPIKHELGLSDLELGLMGGPAFALFYTLLGIPIARLADRSSRVMLMSAALALWSLMTALCGITHSFGQLLLTRLGVGVGEAGGVAPAYAVICDYFPPNQRARALGAYSFGIPIGSALGVLLGGYLTQWLSWREAFVAVGLAGVAAVPLLLTVREPRRGGTDSGPPSDAAPCTLRDVVRVLVRRRSFWGLALGSASASLMGYALFFWMPSFLVRSYQLTLVQASQAYGALVFVGGLAGIWLSGFLADTLGERRKSAYALIPAVAFLATLPFYAAGLLCRDFAVSMLILVVPTALGLAWLAPVLTAVQQLVPARMRVTASAVFLFINNLIGLGLGTPLIGALSDALKVRAGVESLRYAILAGTGFYVIAALLLVLASRHLEDDWLRRYSPP